MKLNMEFVRIRWIIFVVCTLLSATSCTFPLSGAQSEETLRKRAADAWQARLNGNWEKVYDMSCEKFQKAMDKTVFIRKGPFDAIRFKILGIEMHAAEKGKSAIVHLTFDTVKMGIPFTFDIKEPWILENGQWRLDTPTKKTPFDMPVPQSKPKS